MQNNKPHYEASEIKYYFPQASGILGSKVDRNIGILRSGYHNWKQRKAEREA